MLMTVERCNGGEMNRRFTDLSLERQGVFFFPLTWTIVHPIDSSSPLFGLTADDLKNQEAEFLILLKAFDETFSQVVNVRYSYRFDELQWNAKFSTAFDIDNRGDLILQLDRVNDVKQIT
jgi:inward rectifier potassium channel